MPGTAGAPAGYCYGEHAADVFVNTWGPSPGEAIGQAVRATAAMVADPQGVLPVHSEWRYTVSGPDWVSCLVQAVNDYLFLLDSEGALLHDVSATTALSTDGLVSVSVTIRGQKQACRTGKSALRPPPKAATYHLAQLAADAAGTWTARLLLDV